MIYFLKSMVFMLLIVSTLGHILVIIKEKINLSKNMIVIDKKSVTNDFIEETDMKVFLLGGEEIKSGDELKITLHNNKKFNGIVIGAKKKEKCIYLVTYQDDIVNLKINKIKKIKVISRYGKFFKSI